MVVKTQTVEQKTKLSSIEDKELDDLDPVAYPKIAILAHSGTGKTWLAGTAPNLAVLDTDYKVATLKQPDFIKKFGKKRVKYVQISDPLDKKTGLFTEATGFFQCIDKINEWAEDEWVQTICIDTVTSFSRLASHLGLEVQHGGAGLPQRSKTLQYAREKRGMVILTEGDYGAEMNLMEQFMTQLNIINKIVICNFHLRPEYADNGGVMEYQPQITGRRTRGSMGDWFHEIWALKLEGHGDKAKRVLQTQSDQLYRNLKSTLGMPARVENPNMTAILDYLKRQQEQLKAANTNP